jgi:hypothetical protein
MIVLMGKTETKRPEQSERPETIEKILFTSGNKKT